MLHPTSAPGTRTAVRSGRTGILPDTGQRPDKRGLPPLQTQSPHRHGRREAAPNSPPGSYCARRARRAVRLRHEVRDAHAAARAPRCRVLGNGTPDVADPRAGSEPLDGRQTGSQQSCRRPHRVHGAGAAAQRAARLVSAATRAGDRSSRVRRDGRLRSGVGCPGSTADRPARGVLRAARHSG
jgi:hypothetical protein